MTLPSRWLRLSEACALTGITSPDYWKKIEQDRRRPPHARRYCAETHALVPPATKFGKVWKVYGTVLARHINRRASAA